MAKIKLQENEKMLCEVQASHIKKLFILPQANPGKVYVTDMRFIFVPTQGRSISAFEYPI